MKALPIFEFSELQNHAKSRLTHLFWTLGATGFDSFSCSIGELYLAGPCGRIPIG